MKVLQSISVPSGLVLRKSPASSLSELSCQPEGLAVRNQRASGRLGGRLLAFAKLGRLIHVPGVQIVLPLHQFCRDSPLRGSGSGCEGEQPFHVVRHGHQVPLTADVVEATEQELAEAER